LGGSFFMGLEQAPPSRNRLDGLSIGAIQNRILISPPLLRLKAQVGGRKLGRGRTDLYLPTLTDFEATTLAAIEADPRPEELADLAAIDGFFSPPKAINHLREDLYSLPLTLRICRGPAPSQGSGRANLPITAETMIMDLLVYKAPNRRQGIPESGATADEMSAIKGSDFYCGEPAKFPNILKYWGSAGTSYAAITGVSADQIWGAAKLQVANAVTMINVISAYPMPPPIGAYPLTFWVMLQNEIHDLIFSGVLIDPVAVDFWVTGAVLTNYNAMVDHIEKDLKKKAKRAKRKALIKMIGLAVASIVALIVLPAGIGAVAGAIQAGYQTYADIEARKKAAKQFKDASILFEKDASGFSDKLDAYANMLDAQEAAKVAAAGPTPEMQAALDEIPAPTDDLFAVGGIAAAGIAAFFLLR
jgi:hypothetical protein